MKLEPDHSIEFVYKGSKKGIKEDDLGVIMNPLISYKVGDVLHFIDATAEDGKEVYLGVEITEIKNEIHDNIVLEQHTIVTVKDHK